MARVSHEDQNRHEVWQILAARCEARGLPATGSTERANFAVRPAHSAPASNIVKIIYRIDHLADIGLMTRDDRRNLKAARFVPVAIPMGIAVYLVHVVPDIEGAVVPSFGAGVPVEVPSVEKHDRHVNVMVPGLNHSGTKPIEIGLVKLIQIECATL
jgi:hypothetical protein